MLESKSVVSTAVAAAIAEWFTAVKEGGAPDREDFLNRYPDIRSELSRFFENYDLAHESATAPGVDSSESRISQSASSSSATESQPSMVTTFSLGTATTAVLPTYSVATSARFRELTQFNQGGLGNLYRAYDESLHRETAVKMVNDTVNAEPALLAQFRIEAEITGRLNHPGVVPVYGIGEDSTGRPFYVMRLIKGREMSLAIKEYHQSRASDPSGTKTRRQLLTLLEQLTSACKTVAFAHDVGIIHCDIKPANIMVGKFGETFVLDWGLAATFERTANFQVNERTVLRPEYAGESSSSSGPRGGTYGYISPEQLSVDEPITPASDIYSLGATLYEILIGRSPFSGRDKDVCEKIRGGHFQHPRAELNTIPRRLEAICLKAMSLAPDDRYSTATLLAQDLTNWMRDDELLAAPDRWIDRIGRLARRHRGITITLGLTLIATTVAAAWAMHEIEKNRYVEQQNALVQESLDTSLKTLEDLCRPLANGEMHNLTVLLPSMHKIHDFTNEYLRKYEDLSPMQLHTGRVYELRATVTRVLSSDTDTVLKYFKQAEDIYAKQPERSRAKEGTEELQRRLTGVKLNQGIVYLQRAEYDTAEASLVQARTIAESLLEHKHDDPGLKRDLAEIYHLLAEVNMNRDITDPRYARSLDDSKNFFDDSADLLKKLLRVAEGSDKRDLQRDLARSHGYLGDLFLKQGYLAKAERSYEESDELRFELYNSNRMDAEYRFQYARGLGNFGFLQRNYVGHLDAGIEKFVKAEEIQISLTDDFPDLMAFTMDLAFTRNSLAEMYLWKATEQPEKAGDYLKMAQESATKARRSITAKESEGRQNLAWSFATEAAALAVQGGQDSDAARSAAEAANTLVNGQDGTPLGPTELVTLALAKSLQGDAQAAYKVLKDAVDRGENTISRFEKHGRAGLKALNDDPTYGPQYRELCSSIKARLKND